MAQIAPIVHFDVLDLAASVRQRIGQFRAVAPGHRALNLRGPRKGTDPADNIFVWYTTSAKWPELLIVRRKIVELGQGKTELGVVQMWCLDAGAALPWSRDTDREWQQVILPLRSNPGAFAVYGTEVIFPVPGWLYAVNPLAAHTWANHGNDPCWLLIADHRRKESEE